MVHDDFKWVCVFCLKSISLKELCRKFPFQITGGLSEYFFMKKDHNLYRQMFLNFIYAIPLSISQIISCTFLILAGLTSNDEQTATNRISVDEANPNAVVKSQLSTPKQILEKIKNNTPKERGSGSSKRGRPLGSLNKPKDPSSPTKKL